MNSATTFSRRRLLHALAAVSLTGMTSLSAFADDVHDDKVGRTIISDGFTLSLRYPAGGVVSGDEITLSLRITIAGKDEETVPFAKIKAKAIPEEKNATPEMTEVTLENRAAAVSGEYLLTGAFTLPGNYRLSLEVTPPNGGGKAISVVMPLTVKAPAERGKGEPSLFSLKVEATPSQPLPGETVELRLSVVDNRTKKRVTEFEPIYDAPMHFYILRDDVGELKHVKPERMDVAHGTKDDGIFILKYSFVSGGTWRMFAEVATREEGEQLLTASITVPGAKALPEPLMAQITPLVRSNGYTLRLQRPTRLVAHQTLSLPFVLEDSQGQSIDDLQLSDYALAHLYFAERDAKTFLHVLPDMNDPRSGRIGGTILNFPIRFPKPGTYRAWMTFQRTAQIQTLSFVVKVADK